MGLIQSQFQLCDQTTKYHVWIQRCDEEEKSELRWNVHYSQFIKTWYSIQSDRCFVVVERKKAFPPSIALLDCVFISRYLTNFFQEIVFSSFGYVGKHCVHVRLPACREQNILLSKVNRYTYTGFDQKCWL